MGGWELHYFWEAKITYKNYTISLLIKLSEMIKESSQPVCACLWNHSHCHRLLGSLHGLHEHRLMYFNECSVSGFDTLVKDANFMTSQHVSSVSSTGVSCIWSSTRWMRRCIELEARKLWNLKYEYYDIPGIFVSFYCVLSYLVMKHKVWDNWPRPLLTKNSVGSNCCTISSFSLIDKQTSKNMDNCTFLNSSVSTLSPNFTLSLPPRRAKSMGLSDVAIYSTVGVFCLVIDVITFWAVRSRRG